MFSDPNEVWAAGLSAYQPPKRVSVSQGAADYLVIRQPGGYSGPWAADETPYMIEPMDMLASRQHESVVFIGPSRAGKTLGLLDAWMTYAVTCDPGDMLVVQMTQDKAREYSKTRIDRAIRHSPSLAALMSPSGHDDNTHDKLFKNGMWVKIGWPSVAQLSGSDYRYVAMTDYDRMPDSIDGEGDAYGLGVTRIRTFLSRGMCMVESSPGRELSDPNWVPATPHEGPPCSGVVGIYNRSDRRRFYWPCPHCSEFHQAEPGLGQFKSLPPEDELVDIVRTADLDLLAREHARLACIDCGGIIEPKHKQDMLRGGKWLRDGQTIDASGQIHGDGMTSSIAGFWLGGVAAAYQSWHKLILAYLQALREYVMTNSEDPLQKTTNTDQAMPYMPRALVEATEDAHSRRTDAKLERFMVPPEARFLIAAVDVQGGTKARFVVQVHAVGRDLEQWIVDRYEITRGPRGEDIQLDPAGYPEDWDVLTERVIRSTYRIDEDRELRVLLTAVDSGGEAGVSTNAYSWYRRIKAKGMHHSVMLVKGGTSRTESPVTKANARDPRGKPLHDVQIAMVSTDHFKDTIASCRRRKIPGPGFMHFPEWLRATFFDELSAEIRQKNGKWKQIKARNEALDCWVYVLAACWKLGANKLNWDRAPGWAKPLDSNSMVVTPDERRSEKQDQSRKSTPRKTVNSFGKDEWSGRL